MSELGDGKVERGDTQPMWPRPVEITCCQLVCVKLSY